MREVDYSLADERAFIGAFLSDEDSDDAGGDPRFTRVGRP
jgi:hypothetical protein